MHLLVVTQYFWPENFRINELVRDLVASGQRVTVLTGKPNYPEGTFFPGYQGLGVQRESYEGAEVIRLPIAPRSKRSGLRLAVNYLSFVLSGYLLAPVVLSGRRVDAVLVYAPSPLLQALPAILIAWAKRAPLIVWVQDLWPESLSATGYIKNPFLLTAIERVVRFIYRHTDSILIQSQAFQAPIASMQVNPSKIRYYPNSAEAIFKEQCIDREDGAIVQSVRERFSVVFAGNIGSAQSMSTIIGAAKILTGKPDIHFFLVGSGSELEWVANEIQRLQLTNVTLTGRMPITDIPSIYSAASVLLATLKDEPIFAYTIPGKIQSYLAVGRPIIASMNGEGARVVEEAGSGIVCPAEDTEALAAAVLKIFAMTSAQRALMGENGRQYFLAHFEQSKLLAELVSHLESLVSARGATQ